MIDYNELCYQSKTLEMEVSDMSDADLIDECNHVLSTRLESEKMDKLIASFLKRGKLTEEQRKEAVGFYILAYGALAWES